MSERHTLYYIATLLHYHKLMYAVMGMLRSSSSHQLGFINWASNKVTDVQPDSTIIISHWDNADWPCMELLGVW